MAGLPWELQMGGEEVWVPQGKNTASQTWKGIYETSKTIMYSRVELIRNEY